MQAEPNFCPQGDNLDKLIFNCTDQSVRVTIRIGNILWKIKLFHGKMYYYYW